MKKNGKSGSLSEVKRMLALNRMKVDKPKVINKSKKPQKELNPFFFVNII